MLVDRVSEGVVNKLTKGDDREHFIDPAIFVMIGDLVNMLLEAFQDCGQDASGAAEIANDPSLFQRLVVRRRVTDYMGGLREFRRNGGESIVAALLEEGKGLTKSDFDEVL